MLPTDGLVCYSHSFLTWEKKSFQKKDILMDFFLSKRKKKQKQRSLDFHILKSSLFRLLQFEDTPEYRLRQGCFIQKNNMQIMLFSMLLNL